MVPVAIGTNNQLYYENQVIRSNELKYRLADEVRKAPDVTLEVRSDGAVTVEQWSSLVDLGRSAGITNFRLAMRSRILDSPARPGQQ
jgi:biopolymer transport protein ExbD